MLSEDLVNFVSNDKMQYIKDAMNKGIKSPLVYFRKYLN